jgi:hypothetical protein
MSKYLIALAIIGAVTTPACAQTTPATQPAPAANQAQPAKPQMVKKLVCEDNDNPYSNIHRVCHTMMVPAQPNASGGTNQQVPAPSQPQPQL